MIKLLARRHAVTCSFLRFAELPSKMNVFLLLKNELINHYFQLTLSHFTFKPADTSFSGYSGTAETSCKHITHM